ncbi:MAG: hypothetical protein ABIH67_00870 [Candidatus Uhrbacteria bacterium]
MSRQSLPATTKNHRIFLRYLSRLASLINKRNQIPQPLLVFLAKHLFSCHAEITVRHLINSGLITTKQTESGLRLYIDRDKLDALSMISLPGQGSINFPDRSLQSLANHWKAGVRSFNASHLNTPDTQYDYKTDKDATRKRDYGFAEAKKRNQRNAIIQAQTLVNHIFMETIFQDQLNHELSCAVILLGFEGEGNPIGRRQSWKRHGSFDSVRRGNEAGHRWWVTEHGRKFATDSGLQPTIDNAQAEKKIKDNPVKPRHNPHL